jgi:hypothetical protein
MASGSDPVRRLSSHPIDFAVATASSPPGSPEFVSPRGDGSVYGSPQEDFMSARSGSLVGAPEAELMCHSQGSIQFTGSWPRLYGFLAPA